MPVFRYLYRLVGNIPTAEDLSQEVFLRAFRSLHQLRSQEAELGWLLAIARNEFARWCKQSKLKFVQLSQVLETGTVAGVGNLAGAHDQQSAMRNVERSDWVQVAVNELPNEYRIVLNMYYFEHLSYAEIASELGIPMGTVMSRLSRGRNQLHQVLEQVGGKDSVVEMDSEGANG